LEELKAAITFHRKEGHTDRIVSVVLPERNPARERWLSKQEAAKLLKAFWRRGKCRHIAKFMLVGLYTGRRASVVCGASFVREPGRSFIDLEHGLLLPPEGHRQTKKRQPPCPLPDSLLAHMKRWRRSGQRYVVEWGGRPITRLDGTFKQIAIEIGLGEKVTPHVLRHTAASWLMRAGTDIMVAGRYLGMTTKTLESTYAHHRPEHLASARDARMRQRKLRMAAAG
jgi:integrase